MSDGVNRISNGSLGMLSLYHSSTSQSLLGGRVLEELQTLWSQLSDNQTVSLTISTQHRSGVIIPSYHPPSKTGLVSGVITPSTQVNAILQSGMVSSYHPPSKTHSSIQQGAQVFIINTILKWSVVQSYTNCVGSCTSCSVTLLTGLSLIVAISGGSVSKTIKDNDGTIIQSSWLSQHISCW